jgi:hypothetical protein
MRKALEAHHRNARPSIDDLERRIGPVSELTKTMDTAAGAPPKRERRRG